VGAHHVHLLTHARYPGIADYGLISDCHSCALVSKSASIDWCCVPRIDAASCFGRLLDWDNGGYCAIEPAKGEFSTYRTYVDQTMVLQTNLASGQGEVRIFDFFAMRQGGRLAPYHQLIRVVEGVRGRVDLKLSVRPRFDFGEVKPWIKRFGERAYAAIGGANGLLISSDAELEGHGHDLLADFTVRADERVRLSIQYFRPEQLDREPPHVPEPEQLDQRLTETLEWWVKWASAVRLDGPDAPSVTRSAIVLKALSNAPTGAIAAAATTSLPEWIGGSRNWDYRFSWIRDSSFSVRSLGDVGVTKEADGFRRFIQRSAAGSAKDLQIMYGVGGERRLTEVELPKLEGYQGSKPVRIGNQAAEQLQLDAYGELVLLSYRWHRRGYAPDDDYWRFLLDLVDTACERWTEPDRGIWEIRGRPQHFVHSKALCWTAVDLGIRLAAECMRKAPVRRWRKVATEIREAIDDKGYDKKRGVFVQSFGSRNLDAALLLLPSALFVDYLDERMVRTARAIGQDLERDGLVVRYRTEKVADGMAQSEGTFLACTFWLAECLARQGELEQARELFDRAAGTSNDLGLYSEEYDSQAQLMLGNFPQGLTHLSHIAAAVALADVGHVGA
jgi:GH15 family glucan-1,4-alpha-glucosidase